MAAKTRQEVTDRVSLKGTSEGLVVSIGQGAWSDVVTELAERIEREPAFFDGARAILNTGLRELSPEHLREVQQLLSTNKIQVSAVRTATAKTAAAAAALEIPTEIQSENQQAADTETERSHVHENALFVRRTIRSGQTVRSTGAVTVLGDVNPGGEVVAGGDIVIWGKLRGTVHAGATGDNGALVCALVLAPTQLRIGNHIARSPEEEVKDLVIPEMARVQENGIVVEPWSLAKP